MIRELKGWHVLAIFVGCFSVIITVNLALAYNAVSTFPGLEVKNSYVASQKFDAERKAQDALGWQMDVTLMNESVRLRMRDRAGHLIQPHLIDAEIGRPTHTRDDQDLSFVFDGTAYMAPAHLEYGVWALRVEAQAHDGTVFRQRVMLRVR